MSTPKNSPYSGTIFAPNTAGGCAANICKEFFELPTRHRNQVSIVVKASSGAQILLYDESQDEKWALKITLGSDNGSNSSIGLNTRDSAQEAAYPTVQVATPNILNANHLKAFVIQWRYGVIKVLHDGGDEKDPLLTWTGPSDMRIGHFGVRTLGSFGVWRVQGGPEFNTAQTDDIGATYQPYQVNSGRLQFEVRGNNDFYFVLSNKPSDAVAADLVHLVIGGWSNNRSDIMKGLGEVAFYAQTAVLNPLEYRRFWVQWSGYNIWFGVAGTTTPKMFCTLAPTTPLTQLNYFGVVNGFSLKAYVRILEDDEDTVSNIGAF